MWYNMGKECRTEILTTTDARTYELLANELIGHFPVRVARRLNNTKSNKVKKMREKGDEISETRNADWHTSWERNREARPETRERKPKGF